MGRSLDALDDAAWELKRAQNRFNGDAYTADLIADMAPALAAAIPDMDFGDDTVVVGGVKLLCLGELPYRSYTVGNVRVKPWAYLGSDGRFYIEGPRKKKLGSVVIDIHPYQLADARGFDEWFGGVSRHDLAEMLFPFYI